MQFFKKIHLDNIKTLSTNKWLLIGFILLLTGTIYILSNNNSNNQLETYTIKKGNLEEAVSLTGRVKPGEESQITFEKSGVIRSVNVKIGDKVIRGQALATISDGVTYAKVDEARANLNASLASLEEMQNGNREEQIELKKIALENIKVQIDNQYKNIDDSIKNIFINTNDIVRNKFSNIFTGNNINGYTIQTISCSSNNEYLANILRKEADLSVDQIQNISINYLNSDNKDYEIEKVKKELAVINNFLNTLNNLYRAECMLVNTNYDNIRLIISTALTSLNTNKSDLNTKINALNTLKISQKTGEEELSLSEKGERIERIKAEQARVASLKAKLDQVIAEANKNVLLAPFSGIITDVNLNVGEFITSGSNKNISIISDGKLEIESKVSEIDVAKLSKNLKAEITFDSYGENTKFEAVVSNVSPAGIISDGVPTYKTIFNFLNSDERIKSGMTANIKVTTKIYENILTIPVRFIKTKDGNKVVLMKNEIGETEEKIITIGAKGLNGEVEVKSGLNENDVIVLEK